MDNMVRKASVAEIVNHWVMAISCIILSIQGFGFLFHIEGIGSFFGGFPSMKVWHNYLGLAFLASLVVSLFFYLKEALTYDADDAKWISVAGGYLSKKVTVPPMGKLNTGQKLYYLALLVLGLVISATGLALWLLPGSKAIVVFSHLVHNISFAALMIVLPAHMYLGSLANPGTFRIMVYGTIPYWWAKKKHPKWVAGLKSHT